MTEHYNRMQKRKNLKKNEVLKTKHTKLDEENDCFLGLAICNGDGKEERMEPIIRLRNERPFEEVFTLGTQIGEGTFGTVWDATHVATSNRFAVKKFEVAGRPKEVIDEFNNEIATLKMIEHEGIIQFEDYFKTDTHIHLVTELVYGGDLMENIIQRGCISEEATRAIVTNILNALIYLHSWRFVHRDIKPANILMVGPNDPVGVKICDFGVTTMLTDSGHCTGKVFTPGYGAPELIEGLPYSQKVDVYGLGIITFMLLTGCTPWSEKLWDNDIALNNAAKANDIDWAPEMWDSRSDNAMYFVNQATAVHPEHRLSAQDLLCHVWLSEDSSVNGNMVTLKNRSRRRRTCCFFPGRKSNGARHHASNGWDGASDEQKENHKAAGYESSTCNLKAWQDRRDKIEERVKRRERKFF